MAASGWQQAGSKKYGGTLKTFSQTGFLVLLVFMMPGSDPLNGCDEMACNIRIVKRLKLKVQT